MTVSDQQVQDNYHRVRGLVDLACERAGRSPDQVALLPVSKFHPTSMIRALIEIGCGVFGENRVQEMVSKATELGAGVAWVLIGHLQRNKAAQAAGVMSQLQSLDSLTLASALERRLASAQTDTPLSVLIEVNTSGELSKWGVQPDQVMSFTAQLAAFPHLAPRGLMTVAHPDPGLAEQGFADLALLRDQLRTRDGGGWEELSMGMSHDFPAAIAHGSTCVRIGTAIFGPRPSAV
ncbi:MAG: YggS family pyridoxal phosphate-dependent enzyme [Propionibacteriaceae bacterium]|jgi:pyridoxal phosphate enzyme (YggS family)|nr:YggS family pyridoxal phosphate-dependent enzyme [Propionibacteriaceae bacterium]